MEVLNRNQRQSAIWRLIGLGFVVLGVNAIILLAVHNAYANQGGGEAEAVRKEKQKLENAVKGSEQDYKNQIKNLQGQVNLLKTENAGLKKSKDDLMTEYKILKTRNENVEKDLDRCILSKSNN